MPCLFPLCTRATADDYCIGHKMYSDAPKAEKKKVPIARQSDKRKKDARVLGKLVKAMKDNEEECALKGPTCTFFAVTADHIQKRSPNNLLDPKNLNPACSNCNQLKEDKPELFPAHTTKSRFAK